VAPFHPLRHETRALAARAGAAFAVFVAVAFVLLAGGGESGLASAKDGGRGVLPTTPPAGAEEPVLGSSEPIAEPAPSEPVAEQPVAEQPVVEEPVVEEPGSEAPEPVERPAPEAPDPAEPVEPSDPTEPTEPIESADPSSGARRGEDDEADLGLSGARRPPEDDEEAEGPPSAGGKELLPADDDATAEPAPELSARPQAVAPDTTSGQAGTTDTPPSIDTPSTAEPVGGGTGRLTDPETSGGDGQPSGRQVRFTLAANQGGAGGGGGAPAPDTAGGSAGDAGGGASTGTSGDTGAGEDGDGGGGEGGSNQGDEGGQDSSQDGGTSPVIPDPIERVVNVVPDELKAALAALAALSVLLGVGYLLAALRARRLARQRRELLQEVGLLQTALLPPVPAKLGALRTSVAYRPADGPGAGGDFYDVLPLAGGRVGFILGDVSGHGRGALARTAFMRYTLRAYLEAGLEPRVALQVAGRVIDDNLGGDFATVLLAVHDPETGSVTYATAGHPAPIVVGREVHDPVTAASSPPIGVGVRTGLRQTTVPLVPGSVACLFTDGLMEARTQDGILGRERLAQLLAELGDDASASRLIEQVAAESSKLSDDMAAVIVTPTAGVTAGLFRTEQLELSAAELEGPIARRFLEACDLPADEVDEAERDARLLADRFGGVVLNVVFGNRQRVEVLPRNVESIEAASRRVSAGSAQ
jgi:hypothetical protein